MRRIFYEITIFISKLQVRINSSFCQVVKIKKAILPYLPISISSVDHEVICSPLSYAMTTAKSLPNQFKNNFDILLLSTNHR